MVMEMLTVQMNTYLIPSHKPSSVSDFIYLFFKYRMYQPFFKCLDINIASLRTQALLATIKIFEIQAKNKLNHPWVLQIM